MVRNRNDCAPGAGCIYRANRQADGSYSGTVKIAQTTQAQFAKDGDCVFIGEVSLTADGKFMYFGCARATLHADAGTCPQNEWLGTAIDDFDIDLAVARHP